jgi:hypothetical protein
MHPDIPGKVLDMAMYTCCNQTGRINRDPAPWAQDPPVGSDRLTLREKPVCSKPVALRADKPFRENRGREIVRPGCCRHSKGTDPKNPFQMGFMDLYRILRPEILSAHHDGHMAQIDDGTGAKGPHCLTATQAGILSFFRLR